MHSSTQEEIVHRPTSSHSLELRGLIVLCATAAAVYMIAAAPARVLHPAESTATTVRAEKSPAHRARLPNYYFPSQFPAPIGPVDEAAPTF